VNLSTPLIITESRSDLNQVRAAFGVVSECRRLPVMMEVFLGETAHL